jgi:uncharacterized protein YjdB
MRRGGLSLTFGRRNHVSQFVVFVSTLAVMAMSGSINAQESNKDAAVQEITRVLNDVWDKWDSADPDHHAHFSDDMTRIRALEDPVNWAIGSRGLMSEEQFAEQAGEILHVDVNGDGALITARQSVSMPDSTKKITVNNSWTEVILLRKTNSEWKLTHSLYVHRDQGVWHWDPE